MMNTSTASEAFGRLKGGCPNGGCHNEPSLHNGHTRPSGHDGFNGHKGLNGHNGLTGHSDPNGYNGLNGHSDLNGHNGLNGHSDHTGHNGQNGHNGLNGYSGLNGHNGPTTCQDPSNQHHRHFYDNDDDFNDDICISMTANDNNDDGYDATPSKGGLNGDRTVHCLKGTMANGFGCDDTDDPPVAAGARDYVVGFGHLTNRSADKDAGSTGHPRVSNNREASNDSNEQQRQRQAQFLANCKRLAKSISLTLSL